MKIKNKDILRFASAAFGEKRWPVRLAYAVSVNAEAVAGTLKAFDENRKKLAEKYARKDKDGKPVITEGAYEIEDVDAFNEAFGELQEAETEVSITTVGMADIERCDGPEFDTITVAEMAVLKFMVE